MLKPKHILSFLFLFLAINSSFAHFNENTSSYLLKNNFHHTPKLLKSQIPIDETDFLLGLIFNALFNQSTKYIIDLQSEIIETDFTNTDLISVKTSVSALQGFRDISALQQVGLKMSWGLFATDFKLYGTSAAFFEKPTLDWQIFQGVVPIVNFKMYAGFGLLIDPYFSGVDLGLGLSYRFWNDKMITLLEIKTANDEFDNPYRQELHTQVEYVILQNEVFHTSIHLAYIFRNYSKTNFNHLVGVGVNLWIYK